MRAGSALLPLTLGCLALAAGLDQVELPHLTQQQQNKCDWHSASTDFGISSWEFQLRVEPDRNATLPRADWEAAVERSFEAVERCLPALRLDRSSRRTMIWHEAERALSTDDGRPLDPAPEGVRYPFSQIGVLRLRLCLAVDAAEGAEHLSHLLRPGEADLTLKLKGIDPAAPPRWHEGSPITVHGARLAVKQEDDVHCTYQRISYSAVFHRAKGLTTRVLERLRRVRRYFPTLPALLHLDRDFPLPPHLDHFQSKTYWDVIIAGVRGTVQLYANSPDRASALEGSACYPFELSMRVAREDAGDRLGEVLKLVGSAGDVLGDNGWDATRAGFSAA